MESVGLKILLQYSLRKITKIARMHKSHSVYDYKTSEKYHNRAHAPPLTLTVMLKNEAQEHTSYSSLAYTLILEYRSGQSKR